MSQPTPPTQPPGTDPPPTPQRPAGGHRLALIPIAVALALCGALSAVSAWLGHTILTGTVQAGQGAPCPACAVDVFIRAGPINPFGSDDLSVAHVMCNQRRNQLRQQLRTFATSYHQAAAAHGLAARLETGKTISGNAPSDIADGHTWLIMRIHHTMDDRNGTQVSASTHQWRFEVVQQDGWRVCTAELPTVCGNLIRCDTLTLPTRTQTNNIRKPRKTR